MKSSYSLLVLSIILILGRQGLAKLLDEGCRPRYIPLIMGGGEYANPHPHMVYLRLNGEEKCMGSLISNRFVLTAKHCTDFKGNYKVRLGKYEKSTPKQEVEISVESIIPHSDKYIDMALLKLEQEVEYQANIKPICIIEDPEAKSQLNSVTEFTVTGWVQNSRQEALLHRTSPSSCGKHYGYVCVKTPDQFSCEGDSGSPLGGDLKYNGETVFAQFGVLAGDSACNSYSDVVQVTPWIVSIIQHKEEEESIFMKIINFFSSFFK